MIGYLKINVNMIVVIVCELTILSGDIIATGTPEGVGPIQAGDRVRIKIDEIGEFTVDVKLAEEVHEKL